MEKNNQTYRIDTRTPSTSDDIKNYWDHYGAIYSKNVEGHTMKNGVTQFEKCLNHINKPNDIKLYEFGFGSGQLAEYILKTHGDRFNEARFSDLSHYMTDKAKNRLKPLIDGNNWNVIIEERNSENFEGLADNYFDIILGNLCIHIVENPHNVFEGAKRCLKKDGVLFLSYLDSFNNSKYFCEYNKILEKYGLANQKNRSMFYFAQEDMINKLTDKFGFRIVDESNYDIIYDDSDQLFNMYKENIEFNKIESILDHETFNKFLQDIRDMINENKERGVKMNTNIINKRLIKLD